MDHWRYYIQGRLVEALNQREAAISAYREALRVKPDFHRCTNRIAYLLASMDRFADAEKHFREALRLDPENAVAHFNLGYTLEKLGRHDDAIASFRHSTRINPKIDRAWYGMGLCLAHGGRHGEAAAALEEAALLQPMNPHAWYALGMANHASGNPARLKEVIMHLHRFDPRMSRRLIRESGSTELEYLVKDLVV
jgi:tetratricopeptide (TPR) repeat protein